MRNIFIKGAYLIIKLITFIIYYCQTRKYRYILILLKLILSRLNLFQHFSL